MAEEESIKNIDNTTIEENTKVKTKRGRKPTKASIEKKNATLDKKIKKLKEKNRSIIFYDTILLLAWLGVIFFIFFYNFYGLVISIIIVSATTFTKKQTKAFAGIPYLAFIFVCYVCAPFILIIDLVNMKKREKEILELSNQKIDVSNM